jgi:hypothetical protein
MRVHYMSDLHLEAQGFSAPMPQGDVLIVAGDLCHACCFEAEANDSYNIKQRDRALCLIDAAVKNFTYKIGRTEIRTDARGFDGKDLGARKFTGQSFFEI